MSGHVRENLLRLMAAEGLSLRRLSERSGLNPRTIRGVLHGRRKPHARTLHRLAQGLRVDVAELFLDPKEQPVRRYAQQTNPVVAEVVAAHPRLFLDWSEADFDELLSRVGTDGPLTAAGAIAAAEQMNRKRRLHGQLDVLLESGHAELVAALLEVIYQKVVIER